MYKYDNLYGFITKSAPSLSIMWKHCSKKKSLTMGLRKSEIITFFFSDGCSYLEKAMILVNQKADY